MTVLPPKAPLGSLDTVAQFHIGGYINVIRDGSLAMRTKDASEQEEGSMLFCTREGAIGMLLPLDREQFDFLDNVQMRMRQVVHGVGGFSHESWRAFKTQNVVAPATGAIDGDLIEQFVDLSQEQKNLLVAGPPALTLEQDGTHQPVTVAALTQRIEELIRLH